MGPIPGTDDINAMQDQGDFKDFLRHHLGLTQTATTSAEAEEAAPASPSRRPGAWPAGSRPPEPTRIGTPEQWQHAVDEYRAWNAAGQPPGDYRCECGCTPGLIRREFR